MQSSFSQQSILVVFALLLGAICLLANGQMTFSDGWGKRSSAPFALLQKGANKRQQAEFGPLSPGRGSVSDMLMGEEDALNPAMEACHVGYAQRLVQLHEQMLTLYGNYQQCQAKALGGQPKNAGQKAKGGF